MTTVLRFALLLFLVCSGQVYAEGITKEQGDAILKELKGIRQELKEIKKRGLRTRKRTQSPAYYCQCCDTGQSHSQRLESPGNDGGVHRLPVSILPQVLFEGV